MAQIVILAVQTLNLITRTHSHSTEHASHRIHFQTQIKIQIAQSYINTTAVFGDLTGRVW